jgi:hypothetical protein
LSEAAHDIDETIRASKVADANVKDEVERHVRELLSEDSDALAADADASAGDGPDDTDASVSGSADDADDGVAVDEADDDGQASVEEFL